MNTTVSGSPTSYGAFAGGLIGYLLFMVAVALAMWEPPWPLPAQVAVMSAPPAVLAVLMLVPATRRRGGGGLRGLAIGCLSGGFLVLVTALLARLSEQ